MCTQEKTNTRYHNRHCGWRRRNTMQKNIWVLIAIVAVSSVAYAATQFPQERKPDPVVVMPEPVQYTCDGDGKVCDDGSVVGRTGEDCHFMACPSPSAIGTTIQTTLGQKMTGMNISITPKEVVSDSRCSMDVQCVWAGTVEVRAVVETAVGHGEHVFKIGEPFTFGDVLITLSDVTPTPKAGKKVPDSSYRFMFEVKKK